MFEMRMNTLSFRVNGMFLFFFQNRNLVGYRGTNTF